MSQFDFSGMQDKISQAAEAQDWDTEIEFKPMFGGQCAYFRGRIFASLSNIGLALKLSPAAQEGMLAVEGAKRLQYEPGSPPSKQYIVVPPALLSEAAAWNDWFKQSVEYVLTLPAPKPKKSK